jgi:choline dehydrogenase-like flavoprotein
MILDIEDCDATTLQADVCVVGSGAAGITVASALAHSSFSLVVLEAGGTTIEPAAQALYRSEIAGLEHGGIHELRFRVFGGTTTRWAGQALPLMDIDLQARTWIPSSGWPIARGDLEPYYQRACELLEIPAFLPSGSNGEQSPIEYSPGFDPARMVALVSRFSPRPNFASSHGARLASRTNVRVVLRANVTELVTDAAATCVALARARGLSGREIAVRAGVFVVCAGGIETPRILLASDRHAPGGVGNGNDLVGRCFQDHPGVEVGPIRGGDRRRTRKVFRPRRIRGVRYQPLFRVSERLQREEALLNMGGAALYPMSRSLQAGKVAFRSLRERRLDAEARGAWREVVRNPFPTASAAGRYFVLRQPALDTSGVAVLTVGGEQAPNRDSRVYLSAQVDALGMRKLVLDWRLTTAEIRSWQRFAEVAAGELERCGYGSVELERFRLPEDPDDLSGIAVDLGHHIGTTRMATDPSRGVVDRDCRVFGMANLYLASSSVFPTGGFSNPTLTIMALALRLADHVSGVIR